MAKTKKFIPKIEDHATLKKKRVIWGAERYYYTCKHCHQEFETGWSSPTSNVREHLRRMHRPVYYRVPDDKYFIDEDSVLVKS